MAFLNINDTPLKRYSSIPKYYYADETSYECYDERTDLHHDHGWRDLITPEYDTRTEYLGDIVKGSGDDYTYEVIAKTQQEIEAEILAEAEANSQNALQNYMKGLAISQAQEMNDEDALANSDLFPFWAENMAVEANVKYRFWNAERDEIWLWKCIQGHTTQAGWEPYNTPALWVRIAEEGEILKWVQPTGQHDAYQTGEKVYWPEPSDVWQSDVDNNVWEPGVYGWTKIS